MPDVPGVDRCEDCGSAGDHYPRCPRTSNPHPPLPHGQSYNETPSSDDDGSFPHQRTDRCEGFRTRP